MDTSAKIEVPQEELDKKNNQFWEFICGSAQFQQMGCVDDSPKSLKIFDDWYLGIYPFAERYVMPEDLKGKRVMEVGLGMGTMGQFAATYSEHYTGLDIAQAPVNLIKHRLNVAGLNGDAKVGSILEAPFEDASFDVIFAFGCLHHTGNLQKALEECRRLLKPGGRLTMMVYHAYAYTRFEQQREKTFDYLRQELMGYRGPMKELDPAARALADSNHEGEAAPHTDWLGKASLAHMIKKAGFKRSKLTLENMIQQGPYIDTPREELLNSFWCKLWGLDLYAHAYV